MRLTISNMVCLGGIDERMNIDISQARFLAVYLSPPSDGVTVYDSRRLAHFLFIGCWCVRLCASTRSSIRNNYPFASPYALIRVYSVDRR